MVKSGRAVLPFDFISRYLMCKRITTLISEIDDVMSCIFYISICAALSCVKQTELVPPAKFKIYAEEKPEVHVSIPADEKEPEVHVSIPADEEEREVQVSIPADEEEREVHVSMPAEEEEEEFESTNFLPPSMQRFQYANNPVIEATAPAEVHLSMDEVEKEVSSTNGGSLPALAEAVPAPELSEALATPAAEEEVPEEAAISAENKMPAEAAISAEKGMPAKEEVESTNGGFFSRFMSKDTKTDHDGTKQLESLEDLVKRIRPTITIIKERVNSTSYGNSSVVQAWLEQLEEVLRNANEMNKQCRGRFIPHRKTRKRISGLISEINALLKWGQVIISTECFKN